MDEELKFRVDKLETLITMMASAIADVKTYIIKQQAVLKPLQFMEIPVQVNDSIKPHDIVLTTTIKAGSDFELPFYSFEYLNSLPIRKQDREKAKGLKFMDAQEERWPQEGDWYFNVYNLDMGFAYICYANKDFEYCTKRILRAIPVKESENE
jgi:hypothetical protein